MDNKHRSGLFAMIKAKKCVYIYVYAHIVILMLVWQKEEFRPHNQADRIYVTHSSPLHGEEEVTDRPYFARLLLYSIPDKRDLEMELWTELAPDENSIIRRGENFYLSICRCVRNQIKGKICRRFFRPEIFFRREKRASSFLFSVFPTTLLVEAMTGRGGGAGVTWDNG